MRFRSITINNLFAYSGENTIEFADHDNNRNITLLMGRNGFGKTSFINSIKMLFGGVSDELRRSVQRKHTPNERQFIMGISAEWWGVLNQTAKQAGNDNCSITAQWIDSSESGDIEVKACREWKLNFAKDTYQTNITVQHALYGEMKGDEAEEHLRSLLPANYIPFFFFDGEKIQELAEGNDNENIKTMELLLNIKPLENMQTVLNDLIRSWSKEAASEEQRATYNDKERQLAAKQDRERALQQQIYDSNDEIIEEEEHLHQVERQLDLLRSGNVSQQKETEIKRDIQNNEAHKQEALENLASAWKRDAFLCITPLLQQRLTKRLEPMLESGLGEQEELLNAIKQRLQNMFDTMPFPNPRLDNNQAQFYKKRIERELAAFGINETVSEFDIANERGKKLYQRLGQYGQHNNILRSLLTTLETAQTTTQAIKKLDNALKLTGGLSDIKQREHDELQKQERIIKDKLLALERSKISSEAEMSTLSRDISGIEKELKELIKVFNEAVEKRKQLDFAQNLRNALNDVKSQLRSQKQEELEKNYNQLLKDLLTSHNLIHKVEIDEHFQRTYKQKNGEAIGMSTVSAGMKQLLATVLLWALKNASGREIPVVIDTPMGRIDRQHQNNLLEKYYPKVAKQVVLLPTDSELDQEKHTMLKPYIGKEYYLENKSGKAAHIKEGSYYG